MVAVKKEQPRLPLSIPRAQMKLVENGVRMRAKITRSQMPPRPVRDVLDECGESFLAFLPYWKFKVREADGSRPVLNFEHLWRGQRDLATLMDERSDDEPWGPWIFALKAGKLGFSELECAFDGYSAVFREPNTRVHIFSRDLEAAKEMLRIVRFGLAGLPPWFGVRLLRKVEAGADTTTQLRFRFSPWDERVIHAYATGENIAIDQSCGHAHLDEFANHKKSKGVWESVPTTVAPGGTLHIVTRGNGEDAFVKDLWRSAVDGGSQMRAFFAPWTARDDRGPNWLETGKDVAELTEVGRKHYAPEHWEEALEGDMENMFLDPTAWDACYDPGLPSLRPDPSEMPMVLSLDAAVSGDSFAIVGATRHPEHGQFGACGSCRAPLAMASAEPIPCPACGGTVMPVFCNRTHGDPAVRVSKVFRPDQFPGGRVDFLTVEGWIRCVCQGGCPGDQGAGIQAHPLYVPGSFGYRREWARRDDCGACIAGVVVPPHNVIKVVYDSYQLEDMMQRFRQDGVATVGAFSQGADRAIADSGLRSMVVQRRVAQNGDAVLREHVLNARAKLQAAEDSRVRMIKKDDKSRIDAAVAASMATDEVLRLYL